MKLSGQSGDINISWAGPSCLAIIVGDLSIRLWDLDSSESYLLVPVQEGSPKSPTRQTFICLSFCSLRGNVFFCMFIPLCFKSMLKKKKSETPYFFFPQKSYVLGQTVVTSTCGRNSILSLIQVKAQILGKPFLHLLCPSRGVKI